MTGLQLGTTGNRLVQNEEDSILFNVELKYHSISQIIIPKHFKESETGESLCPYENGPE